MTITPDAVNITFATLAIVISVITAIKSHSISKENTRLANAGIELEMRNLISESRRYLADVSVKLAPYISNNKDLSENEKILLEAINKQYDEAKENFVNSYEELCMKYIDGKIDKSRFKKNFIVEIRKLVTDSTFKEYFDSHSSPYTAIKKVFDEWENYEN